MKNPFENLFLSKEVKEALAQSKASIHDALDAKQTIDSIYVTEQLAKMFGKPDETLAEALKEDYYTELLIGKMLKDKENEAAPIVVEEEYATA